MLAAFIPDKSRVSKHTYVHTQKNLTKFNILFVIDHIISTQPHPFTIGSFPFLIVFTDILNYHNILFPTDSTGSTFFPPVFRPTGIAVQHICYVCLTISTLRTKKKKKDHLTNPILIA